jgi:hypothetical protein
MKPTVRVILGEMVNDGTSALDKNCAFSSAWQIYLLEQVITIP